MYAAAAVLTEECLQIQEEEDIKVVYQTLHKANLYACCLSQESHSGKSAAKETGGKEKYISKEKEGATTVLTENPGRRGC